jgi:hypothetical protein
MKQTRIDYHFTDGTLSIDANIDLGRIERNIEKAQYFLDSQVMTDMVPYMPMQTGNFIQRTRAMSAAIAGSGKVVAAAPPMGRFLYEGKVMVGVDSHSPFARYGEKKVVTDRDLQYSTAAHPKVEKKWFDAAKRDHGSDWVKMAKKVAGGAK